MPSLKDATKLDFTSSVPGFHHFKKFDQSSTDLIRKEPENKVIVVIDEGYALPSNKPYLVTDHLNLSGDNPLVGPTTPGGPRFPVINNVYLQIIDTLDPKRTMPLSNPLGNLSNIVTAGLKSGVVPSEDDLTTIRALGADCYCYNLVPAMLVAAQLGMRVFAIVVPAGASLDKETASYLKGV